jgi:hypothetical protein
MLNRRMLLGAGPALLADAAHAQGAMRFATP